MPLLIKKAKRSVTSLSSADGMGDTHRGITIAWQDLNVYVPLQKDAKNSDYLSREKRHKPFKRVLSNGENHSKCLRNAVPILLYI